MVKKILNFYKTQLSYKNLFRIKNVFLLLVFYLTAIISIILNSFEFSENFWHKLINKSFSSKRIAVYGVDGRIGEVMLHNSILKVLKRQNIDYIGAKFPEYYTTFFLTKHFYIAAASLLNIFFKPNFNLAVTHHVSILPYGYNVVYLTVPTEILFNKENKFVKRFGYLAEFDAYIDLYSVTNGSNPVLEEALECRKCYDTKIRKVIPGYLAQEYVDYKEANFNKILVTGSLWGCLRSSIRIASLLKKLEQDDILVTYGLEDHFNFLKKSYKGSVESFDKKHNAKDNILKLHQENGIALVIHNLEHTLEGLPTNRIVEAVASGAVAITDENRFIKKFFKDTVFYFDAFESTDKMYEQVKAHFDWIINNPEEARVKAKEAYDIFINNFTIEKQLEKIIEQLNQ